MGELTGSMEPESGVMVPASGLESLRATPGSDDLLERVLAHRPRQVLLDRAEPRLESAKRAAEDGFGLEAEIAGEERGREENVAELVLDARALLGSRNRLRIAREAARFELRGELVLLLSELRDGSGDGLPTEAGGDGLAPHSSRALKRR